MFEKYWVINYACPPFLSPPTGQDGVERHPYWLVKPGHGMLSGILQVTPRVRGNKLTVSLSLKQTKSISRSMIDVESDDKYPISQYAMDHGRKLIKAVRLLKDGQSTKIQMTGPDAQGLFIGTAALGKTSLDGVCLVIDFKFFDETIPVSIDMFAGAAAKQLRR